MKSEKSIYNSLAEWRNAKPNDYLNARKNNLLDEMCQAFGWPKLQDTMDKKWMNSYNSLCEYMKTHSELPRGNIKFNSHSIGFWCGTQRANYLNNQLHSDRIKLLESNTWWNWEFSEDYYWHKKFSLLSKYINLHNKLPGKDEVFENVEIGAWCNFQKETYNRVRRPNTMSKKRVKLLESLDIESWDTGCRQIEKCKKTENFKIKLSAFLREKGVDILAKIIRESLEESDFDKEEYTKILKNRLY